MKKYVGIIILILFLAYVGTHFAFSRLNKFELSEWGEMGGRPFDRTETYFRYSSRNNLNNALAIFFYPVRYFDEKFFDTTPLYRVYER